MVEFPENLVEAFAERNRPETTKRISFLLGSGFSRPDNMPLVSDINSKLGKLKEGDFYLGQDMSAGFYDNEYRDPNARITLNDRRIAEEFIAFYVTRMCEGDPSKFYYEDFFDYFNEFLNEKLHTDEINAFCEDYNKKYRFSGRYDNGLNYLSRFLNIFNQLVASMLQRSEYYQNISYTGGYPRYETFSKLMYRLLKGFRIHVHSLNHDMLFDHMASSVSGMWEYFSDGFTEAGSPYFGEMRYSPKIKEKEFYKTYHVRLKHFTNNYSGRLTFFKLHGSVDYFPTYIQGTNEPVTIKRDYAVNEILKEQFNEAKQQFEYINPFTNKYPAFLTGTTQKIKRYNDPFYNGLFEHFTDNLEHSEKLIVIGYGFQDIGINKYLIDYYLKLDKPIFVVDVRRAKSGLFEEFPENFTFSSGGLSETGYEEYEQFIYGENVSKS